VQQEAAASLAALVDETPCRQDVFAILFLTPTPFRRKFDCVLRHASSWSVERAA
jgi:hypothetical protein